MHYSVESNNEGVNEVRRQRGILYRDQGKYGEARAEFQRALDAARTLGNDAQEISALIDLSYLMYTQGSVSESADFAAQAVKRAQDQHLENLATGGLLELGNSYSGRGDFTNAEKYYKQTIELAQANKGRRREAQGLLNLGGLYIQQSQTEAGLEMVQRALPFFQQGNFSREVSRCFTHIARGKRRQGEFAAALNALNQKLEIAQQGGGQVLIADSYGEMGAVLFDQEKYPEALERYDQARAIYQSVNSRIKFVFAETNRANILWRIGRISEAKQLLSEVSQTANQSENDFKALIPYQHLIAAEISLSERNFADAVAKANEALTLAGNDYRDTSIEASFTIALAKAQLGGGKAALPMCEEAVKAAEKVGDNTLLSRAILAHAEVALQNGDAQTAQALATQAQARFAQGSQLESQWRALLIAAQVSEKLGDNAKRDQYLAEARNALVSLEQGWGEGAFKLYLTRPDIQLIQKQLG